MIIDRHIGLYTDLYELTMAQGFYLMGQGGKTAVFDYFFRKSPFGGSFAVFAGLDDLLELIENFRYDSEDIEYLRKIGFKEDFLNYLKNFKFTGDIYSVAEGEVVFPYEPLFRVHAPLIEAQILETIVLNILNFETLIATKAARMKIASKGKMVIDFGLRRAQGFGGIHASKAAVIGGAETTSNVYSSMLFGLTPAGTMAHSWIQSFDSEYEAFKTFADIYQDKTVLLLDTYDTLKSGILNAVKVGKYLENQGRRLLGVRLDSGDLLTLSKECRKILDENGLDYVKIVASNMLDEYRIDDLMQKGAPIDIFGVGTNLVVGRSDAALDGVYKLISIDGVPKMKISNDPEKVLLPGVKNILRYYDENGLFKKDLVVLEEKLKEQGEAEEILLKPVLSSGKRIHTRKPVKSIVEYAKSRIEKLPDSLKNIYKPQVYNVSVCNSVLNLRNSMIKSLSGGFDESTFNS
ncbi:nicotinate phosphoribosyltransferase [Calditerrivibrio sp.]|uniref:nicotinate phosphoribosyltransferase n=1 Tax=Calditerrivibrio sp. TaxID=2792612 RepID=UPI003D119DF4